MPGCFLYVQTVITLHPYPAYTPKLKALRMAWHPNVTGLIDSRENKHFLFLVMEVRACSAWQAVLDGPWGWSGGVSRGEGGGGRFGEVTDALCVPAQLCEGGELFDAIIEVCFPYDCVWVNTRIGNCL